MRVTGYILTEFLIPFLLNNRRMQWLYQRGEFPARGGTNAGRILK